VVGDPCRPYQHFSCQLVNGLKASNIKKSLEKTNVAGYSSPYPMEPPVNVEYISMGASIGVARSSVTGPRDSPFLSRRWAHTVRHCLVKWVYHFGSDKKSPLKTTIPAVPAIVRDSTFALSLMVCILVALFVNQPGSICSTLSV
jgi:hypothetical protein